MGGLRPYIGAVVVLPRFMMGLPIEFMADTGADVTTICPQDGVPAKIPYDKLDYRVDMRGTGSCKATVESAIITFSDGTNLHIYQLEIAITENRRDLHGLPSLLGRDILNQWTTTCSPRHKILSFDPLQSGLVVPLRKVQERGSSI